MRRYCELSIFGTTQRDVSDVTQVRGTQPVVANILSSSAVASLLIVFGNCLVSGDIALTIFQDDTASFLYLCRATISNWNCNLILTPALVGAIVFYLCVPLLGLQRAAIARLIFDEARQDNAFLQDDKLPPIRIRGGVRRAEILSNAALAGLWLVVLLVCLLRLALLDQPQQQLPICAILYTIEVFIVFEVVVLAGSAASLALFVWAKGVSERELEGFCRRQSRLSLAARANLRYTIRLAHLLSPVVIACCVCQLATGLYFLFFLLTKHHMSTARFAYHQHVQMVLALWLQSSLFRRCSFQVTLHMPPMIVFPLWTGARLWKLQAKQPKTEPTAVVPINTAGDQHFKALSSMWG